MFEYPVVSVFDRCAAAIGPVAIGVQCESASQGAERSDATEFASTYAARDQIEEIKTANELALQLV